MNKFGSSNAMTLVFYPPYSSFRKNNAFQNWDQTLFPLTAKKNQIKNYDHKMYDSLDKVRNGGTDR